MSRPLHELKTWPVPFHAIWTGRKHHELRKNDRDFKVDDLLFLREWDNEAERYTGRKLLCEVTYVTEGGSFGLPSDLCVMSVVVISSSDDPRLREMLVRLVRGEPLP